MFFLAHEDIRPSNEWEKEIIQTLMSTDVFIPIVTRRFSESEWTDQESGIAEAGGKLIIPISIYKTPYGFLRKYQALKIKSNNLRKSCIEIITVIKQDPRFTQSLLDSLLNKLPRISSFDEAGRDFQLISQFDTFSKDQINELFSQCIQNSQIYLSHSARSYLRKLIERYKKMASKKQISELKKKFD